jgi:hypothetical protein
MRILQKNIVLEMGFIFCMQNKCETIELKEWNISNILQDVQNTMRNNLLK